MIEQLNAPPGLIRAIKYLLAFVLFAVGVCGGIAIAIHGGPK